MIRDRRPGGPGAVLAAAAVAVVTAVAGAGCALEPAPDEPVRGRAAQAIVDPTAVPPDAMLYLVQVDTWRGTCTGTLIAPDTVLFASHCVCGESLVGGNVCHADVTVRLRPAPGATAGEVIAGRARFHPDYNPSWTEQQFDHDVATATLERPAPGYLPPIVLGESHLSTGVPVYVAGLGLVGDDCDGDNSIFNYDETSIDDYEDGHDILRFDDERTCKGDSGGPVIDVASETQHGVISMTTWTPWNGFEDKAASTVVDREWIKATMCPSTDDNACSGEGHVCACSASNHLLWREAGGRLRLWLMDGGATYGTTVLAGSSKRGNDVLATGDFDGDGEEDVLLRDLAGTTSVLYVVAATAAGQLSTGAAPDPLGAFQVQGVGDLDVDGRDDVLWRETASGKLSWWPGAEGVWPREIVGAPALDPGAVVLGVGDFDGDGDGDVLLRHKGGEVEAWMLKQGELVEVVGKGKNDDAFQAIGDLDGDLRADVLWRAGGGTGDLYVWFAAAPRAYPLRYQNSASSKPRSATVQGVADLDHDRRDEIVWRDAAGNVSVWLVNGARFVGEVATGAAPTGWTIEGLLSSQK